MAHRPRPPRDSALGAIVVVLVVAFLGMCWWQVTRAVGGNGLSWAYVFEWPLFAGYLVYMWRRLSRQRVEDGQGPSEEVGAAPDGGHIGDVGPNAAVVADEEEDEELAAYNRYLASLAESGRRKHW